MILGGDHIRCPAVPHEHLERITRQLEELQGYLRQLKLEPARSDLQTKVTNQDSVRIHNPRRCRCHLYSATTVPPEAAAVRPQLPDDGDPNSSSHHNVQPPANEETNQCDTAPALCPVISDSNARKSPETAVILIAFSIIWRDRAARRVTARIDSLENVEYVRNMRFVEEKDSGVYPLRTTDWIPTTRTWETVGDFSKSKVYPRIRLHSPWRFSDSPVRIMTEKRSLGLGVHKTAEYFTDNRPHEEICLESRFTWEITDTYKFFIANNGYSACHFTNNYL